MFVAELLRLGCILLCIAAAALSQGGQGDDQCFNTWLGDLGSRGEKCDIFDGPKTLNMTCRINMGTNLNVSLQWLYASQEDKAGLNGMVLEDGQSSNVRFNYSVTVLTTGNQFIVATLELHNEFEIGYYWCRVTGGMDTPNQNPSQVIRISSTCYSGKDCETETLSIRQQGFNRCANGNFAENITILDVQDTSACLVPLTDGPVATTEEHKETSDSQGEGGSEGVTTDSTEESDTTTEGASSDPSGSGSIGGLPTGAIWLIVGLGIAMLLVIICLLLIIIACMHCSKRKVKDTSGDNMPHHFDNLAYLSTEPGLSDSYANSGDDKKLGADTALNGNHTYAVIPENFTLTAFSGEHSPTLQTTQTPPTAVAGSNSGVGGFHHSLPGDYETIDLEPVPPSAEEGGKIRKHQYEAVTNDEDDENYNRLQRSDSKSRKASSSTSTSASPGLPSRGESITPLSPMFKETTTLFDNPKYSQLSKLGCQHPSIYKMNSTDSNSGAAAVSHSDVPAPPQITKAKASKTLSSGKDDDYFHDPSVFIVNGLALDETRRSSTEQNTKPPSEHYSSLLTSTMNEESSYALAIVSSKDKYVSERGHLYQVLEGDQEGTELVPKAKREDFASLSVESKEDEELGFIVNPDARSTDDDDDDDDDDETSVTMGSRSGVVYNTLLRTPTSENSRESSPGQTAYDVIDRNMKHSATSSRNSLVNESAYNVIDRRVSDGNFSGQPPSQYSLIDPQARRVREDCFASTSYDVMVPQACRRVSMPPSQYDTIEPQTSKTFDTNQPSCQYSVGEPRGSGRKPSNNVASPGVSDNGYSMVTRSRNTSAVSSFMPQKSLESSSPPPSYSSLLNMEVASGSNLIMEDTGGSQGNSMFMLESEGIRNGREEGDIIYHTIST